MMLQLLAKVDLEYTQLRNLGQWQSSSPDNQIVALQAKVDWLSKTVNDFHTRDNAKAEPKAGVKPSVIPQDQTANTQLGLPKKMVN